MILTQPFQEAEGTQAPEGEGTTGPTGNGEGEAEAEGHEVFFFDVAPPIEWSHWLLVPSPGSLTVRTWKKAGPQKESHLPTLVFQVLC